MNLDIKLKRICQKGPSAVLIHHMLKSWNQSLWLQDDEGIAILGEPDGNEKGLPVILQDKKPLAWVGGGSHAKDLVALVEYVARKESECRLLGQEILNKYKELTLLYEFGEKITGCLEIDELANVTMAEAISLLSRGSPLEVALILLEPDDDQTFRVAASHGQIFETSSFMKGLDGISSDVLKYGNPEVVDDVNEDSRFLKEPGKLRDVVSLMCMPLKTNERNLGLLIVLSKERSAFSAADLKALNLLTSQTAMALGRVHLIHSLVEQERFQESLKLARDIQMGMLRTDFLRYAVTGQPLDIFAFMQPAREVSGDFYDFFELDDQRTIFVIGDVSDKGMPAALFMVMVMTFIRSIAKQFKEPHRILELLNNDLCRDNDAAMFVTLFLAVLDVQEKTIRYAFGGHNRPLLIRNDGQVNYLEGETGTALGIIPDIQFRTEVLDVTTGDGLLLYTDGVNEAMNKELKAYGDDRLLDVVVSHANQDAEILLKAVCKGVDDFVLGAEQSDDITLLAFRMDFKMSQSDIVNIQD